MGIMRKSRPPMQDRKKMLFQGSPNSLRCQTVQLCFAEVKFIRRATMRTRLVGLAVCLIALGMTSRARAADAPAARPVDGKINASLRDVINRGREFYNAGDPAACFYLFEGALRSVRPLLDHRPNVQKIIDRGLADAARQADMRRRAWALRYVLDDVRSQIRGKGWTPPPPTSEPPSEPAPPVAEATLWSRLGGEAKVKQVVDDFVSMAAEDPAVNFDRDGKLKFTEEQIADLKKGLIAFISQATGGPLKYTGKSMKEFHKGLGITNAEFDAAGADLVKALEKNGVARPDIKALMAIVATTRADIVEAKKPEDMPKEKGKDDEDKPKEKEKIKKPKDDDDEKPKEKGKDDEDKPKEKEKIKKPKGDDEKPKEKDDDKPKKKDDDKEKEKDKDDEKPKDKEKKDGE